jgi:hypothetical protein
LFKVIDKVAKGLNNEFPQYSFNYIVQVLHQNSMNINLAYQFLKNPESTKINSFTSVDDEIIKTMKGKLEYDKLVKSKGADKVQEREDYLMG